MADDPQLLPVDDGEITPEEDVAAAEASALAAASPEPARAEPPQPFGVTPLFDFELGRMVRAGQSPVMVSGHKALEQWCLMAIYSARYAHAVFTDEFGMEDPESVIGQAADAAETAADWGERLREALLVYDRVAAVEGYEGSFITLNGGRAFVVKFTVVTDEDERVDLGPLAVALTRENP